MKYPGNLFIISMAVFGAYFARGAIAAQNAPTAFSTYGLIQPVNKYSSNPFWNTDSPYNQRMPVPVYATGADLNTGDCNRVVETLVATYCASHNYCTDSRINDVRPTVMVQLSQLPGHNFATSCGGYIDSVFENYQKTYGNMSAGTVYYTTAPTVQQTNTAQYKNPLQQKPNAYQTGVAERTAELERLQRATTASPELGPTDFPKTTADLSFTDRLANTTAGYEPYKDLNPYKTPQFESDEEFYERLKKLNPTEYCKHFPTDVETCSKKIHYELFGGTNAANNPKYYIPGQGATISGTPTRSNSIFVSWCTNSALTNCASTQVISKSENTDKTFFAKWDCTNGYLLQNNMCVNPADPNTDPYINPNPNNCPDVAHMDANCQCTVVPGTSIDPSTGMCKCDNGKDINNNCADGTTNTTGPKCLTKMWQQTNYTRIFLERLNLLDKLDITELKNNDMYSALASLVSLSCIEDNATPQDLAEFNNWIDTEATLPITFKFKNQNVTLNIDATDLFNYTNKKYGVILVRKPSPMYALQSTVASDSINFIDTDENCVSYYRWSPEHQRHIPDRYVFHSTAITQSAKGIYGDTLYSLHASKRWSFPGKLLHTYSIDNSATPVHITNYVKARKNIKEFASNLQQSAGCANKDAVIYLIKDKTEQNGGISEITIKSEPFFIP